MSPIFQDIEKCRLCGSIITTLDRYVTHKRLDDYADFLYNDEMVIVHLCPECAIIMLKNIIRNESDKSEWKQHELEKHWQEQMR